MAGYSLADSAYCDYSRLATATNINGCQHTAHDSSNFPSRYSARKPASAWQRR
jgi:hypothetical protein